MIPLIMASGSLRTLRIAACAALLLASGRAFADPWNTGAGNATGDVFVSGPAGAQLLLDNAPTGLVAPATLKQVPVGQHVVSVRQGCMISERTIEVHAGLIERVDPVLAMGTSSLTVGVNVDGANVTLDGKAVGTSPLTTLPVECGTHDVAAAMSGYTRAQSTVETHAGETLTVNLTLAREQVGNITVDVMPLDAEVLLDGKSQGAGPRTLSSIPAGAHTVVARARGYADGTMPVALGADETARVNLSLVPRAPLGQRLGLDKVPWAKVGAGTGLALVAGGAFTGAVLFNQAATENYTTYAGLTYADSPDEYYATSVSAPRTLSWVAVAVGGVATIASGLVWLDVGGVHLFPNGGGVSGTF